MNYRSTDIGKTAPSSEDEDIVLPPRYTWPVTLNGGCIAPLEGEVVDGCLSLYRKRYGEIPTEAIFIHTDEKVGIPSGERTYLVSALVVEHEARFGTSFAQGAFPAGISYYIRGYDEDAQTNDDTASFIFSAVIDIAMRH